MQIVTCTSSKQPNLLLKTRPKQVLGSLPLAFALHDSTHKNETRGSNPATVTGSGKMTKMYPV